MDDNFHWPYHYDTTDEAPQSARPRRFALTDKLRIVREASQPGVKFAHIERKYGLGKNVLSYWRKVYRDLAEVQVRDELAASAPDCSEEIAALRVQVRRLERLLGQKTLEIDLLRGRMQDKA